MAKMTRDDFTAQLKSAYGPELRAIVVYGSAATAEHQGRATDQNVMVVVGALSLTSMRAAGAVAAAWGEAGNPPPLTLTENEWKSSVDVFAIEHTDIEERHHLMYVAPGYDLFAGIRVSPADVRQQLEYEALAALLRVRGRILASGADAKARSALLASSLSPVLAVFRAFLRLTGRTARLDNEATCRAAGEAAGFDPAAFLAVVAHRRGTTTISAQALDGVLEGYHAGLARLVACLDTLPT